jgi:hypothetical protein
MLDITHYFMYINTHDIFVADSTPVFIMKTSNFVISVGFWRWCVGIERIVLLDFIHRLVSQKIEE